MKDLIETAKSVIRGEVNEAKIDKDLINKIASALVEGRFDKAMSGAGSDSVNYDKLRGAASTLALISGGNEKQYETKINAAVDKKWKVLQSDDNDYWRQAGSGKLNWEKL